jgi:hypothetical protein
MTTWEAEEDLEGRHDIRWRVRSSEGVRSCRRAWMLLGQLPPTRVLDEVARSLESSDGKNGTLTDTGC